MFRRKNPHVKHVLEDVLARLAEGDEEEARRTAWGYVRGPGADPEGEALLALVFALYRLEGAPLGDEKGGKTR